MSIKPIYDFEPLKKALIRLGYQVGEANPFTPHTEDLSFEQMKDIEFVPTNEGGGIKIKDSRQRTFIGFLYKKRYNHRYNDKISDPKAHLCNCKIIQQIGKDEYRFANSSPITYYDSSSRSERTISHLDLCAYCLQMLRNQYSSTNDFIEQMTEKYGSVGQNETVDVDINGYTRDWEKVSKAYRRKKDYKCEQCGWVPRTTFERYYIQVHHINGDKTNNSETNLKCLCIECHSKADNHHKENFSHGANEKQLGKFLQLKGDTISIRPSYDHEERKYASESFNDDLPF